MKRLVLLLAVAGCWSKPERVANDGVDDPVTLAAGGKHACAIRADGTLRCWGNNEHGQLGDLMTTTVRTGTPIPIETPADPELKWLWVAAGDTHTCGITESNVLRCWGDDTNGQVGGGASEPAVHPMQIPLPGGATPAKVYAGYSATCAIDTDGHLYCWGVFDLDRRPHTAPEAVQPGGNDGPWRSVAIGELHICALHDGDNRAYCWGKNDFGQLGVPDDESLDLARAKPDREFVALAASHRATCGVTLDRELVCFGDTALGLIGPAPDAPRHEDFLVDSARRWSSVALGPGHTCAIADGGIYCFGTDDRGVLGSFDQHRDLPAMPIANGVHVVAGESFSCAQRADRSVVCWGSSSDGELGNGEIATQRVPSKVALGTVANLISAGRGHSCAVVSDSTTRHVWCWGDNRHGQVIPNGDPFITTPTLVSQDPLYLVAAGGAHTCAADPMNQGLIHCWGDNASRQLGSSTGVVDLTKLGIPSASSWYAVTAGERSTCARDDLGNLTCWGDLPGTTKKGRDPTVVMGNYGGDLAFGGGVLLAQDQGTKNSVAFGIEPMTDCAPRDDFPVAHGLRTAQSPAEAVDLSVSEAHHGCGMVKTSAPGELFCWGLNDVGQTGAPTSGNEPGDCTRIHQVDPVAPAQWDVSSLRVVLAAGRHSCAIDSMHRVWCWGLPEHGNLGTLEGASETPRIAVPDSWRFLTGGPYHTCAISSDDASVSCWGENRFGELGNGLRFHPDPVEVHL